jgi:hypothetical protein
VFPVKHGFKLRAALSSLLSTLLLNMTLGGKVNQEGLKLNGTNQILVYAGDNILGGSVNAKKK